MMEVVFYMLVAVACLGSLLNLILTVFVALFLVRLRDRMGEFFSDSMQVMTGFEAPEAVVPMRPKTWDEKYEDELIEREKARRRELGEPGLMDLR